ncbi:MAG TPA: hypothetical protein VMF87_11690 [Streptosporangiaceae bacterium]|nr:hypothetical protein [Streptosporangiaceae bacterium]
MNAGGDPDRDDFGLPPVDIEVPDDARELDRDVQAYQRELRAVRRRQRARRLRAPLTREGMVLPLLAGCLILALITSTLLIMFAADQTGMPEQPGHVAAPTAPAGRAATGSQPAAGKIGGPLPSGEILVAGKPVSLRQVTGPAPAVLALVPLDCNCAPALRELTAQAAQARVPMYLVAASGGEQQLQGLAAHADSGQATLAEDTSNVLFHTYGGSGLRAILVRPNGLVTSVARSPWAGLDTTLQQLKPATPAGH